MGPNAARPHEPNTAPRVARLTASVGGPVEAQDLEREGRESPDRACGRTATLERHPSDGGVPEEAHGAVDDGATSISSIGANEE